MGAELIAAAGSLLGGLLGKKSAPKDVVPNYAKRRRDAEAAGFNPLTALGVQASVGQSANYMGSAIADAALLLADGLEKDKEKAENEALKAKNKELQEKVTSMTLRPKVPGVYGQRSAVVEDFANGPLPLVEPVAGVGVDKPTLGQSVDGALGSIPVPDPFLDRGSPFLMKGRVWESPPGWTSPAEFEERVGGDNILLTTPYSMAWTGALIDHNVFDPWRRRRDWEKMRARRKSDDADHLARQLGSKPRSRTTDWEKRHKSRWIFD